MKACALIVAILLIPAMALADQATTLAGEIDNEVDHIKEDCGSIKTLHSCAATLVTDHPFHIALGSIAPLNGFGAGPAFVINRPVDDNWRNTFSADAIFASGDTWRAGAYFKGIHTVVDIPQPMKPGAKPRPVIRISEYPIYGAFAQIISLPNLTFYGLGPDTDADAITTYGLKETIFGGTANVPLKRFASSLRMSLFAEANGRVFDVQSGTHPDTPQLSARFNESTAPGLTTEPAFVQIGEGVRLRPFLFNDRLQLRYTFNFQHFISPQSDYSFNRWTIDLSHEVPIYHTALAIRLETNSPNGCLSGPTAEKCPSITRDRWGAFSLRLMASKSMVGDSGAVPFYLQHTLGGSDLDGNRALASYADYRFRGPHLILLQETVEHSIWGPFGAFLQAEQGKVASQTQSLNFSRLRHTATIGATIRAGGFPMLTVAWGTGANEGSHVIVMMDTSLLGGGSRPPLQ